MRSPACGAFFRVVAPPLAPASAAQAVLSRATPVSSGVGHTGLLDYELLDPSSLPDMNRLACTRHRDRIVLLLAAALVVVQLLGMMHAVLHDHARASPAHAFAQVAPELPSTEPSGFGALFSGHDSQADCDLFDHITHADLAGLDAPAFAAAHSDGIVIAGHPGWHIAQQAAGFLARGPPLQL